MLYDPDETAECSTGDFDVDGSGHARRRGGDPDPLIPCANWANGTFVEEVVLPVAESMVITPERCGQAVAAMVCLDDCAALHISDRDGSGTGRPAPAGSVFLFDLRELCRVRADKDVRVVLFGIQLKVIEQLVRRSRAEPLASAAELLDAGERFFPDPSLHGLALSVQTVLRNSEAARGFFLEQVACAVAAHLLLRRGGSDGCAPSSGGLAPWQLAKAKKLVVANMGRTLQAHELARACGLSPSHFSRAFRRSTGTSPHAWLVDQRIAHAKHLMRSSDTRLAEIALECGFADQSHLTRVFTRGEGISPGLWRRYIDPAASGTGLQASAAADGSGPGGGYREAA